MNDMKRTALAKLIDETLERNEWPAAEVARNATRSGHMLTTSDVSLYRKQGMPTLVPGKVIALAAGLRLPAYRVAVTVLEDLGINVPVDVRTPEAAIHHDHTLTARTKEQLLLLIEHDRV